MSHTEQDYAARIRAQGYRLTPQRQIILDTLCELGGHVPITALVEAVQAQAPAIDRATVYRSVSFFAGLELVVSSDLDGVTVVEMTPGGQTEHGHLLCRRCGHIEHVPASLFDAVVDQLASSYGFSADLGRQTIEGICHQCGPAAPPEQAVGEAHAHE